LRVKREKKRKKEEKRGKRKKRGKKNRGILQKNTFSNFVNFQYYGDRHKAWRIINAVRYLYLRASSGCMKDNRKIALAAISWHELTCIPTTIRRNDWQWDRRGVRCGGGGGGEPQARSQLGKRRKSRKREG
jgi:hypothetical protein